MPRLRRVGSVPRSTIHGRAGYQERVAGKGGAFSASPVAGDGKLYLSGEDGDVFVLSAGPKPELLASNPMGEVLMATPAISDACCSCGA